MTRRLTYSQERLPMMMNFLYALIVLRSLICLSSMLRSISCFQLISNALWHPFANLLTAFSISSGVFGNLVLLLMYILGSKFVSEVCLKRKLERIERRNLSISIGSLLVSGLIHTPCPRLKLKSFFRSIGSSVFS